MGENWYKVSPVSDSELHELLRWATAATKSAPVYEALSELEQLMVRVLVAGREVRNEELVVQSPQDGWVAQVVREYEQQRAAA